MTRAPLSRRRAFTRVDLAVVLIVSLLLVGLLQASVSKVREASARLQCQDDLHNLAAGIHNYASGNQDKFPPMLDHGGNGRNLGFMPFWFSLYPELEQNNLYRRANGSDGWAAGNHNAVIKILLCPSDPSPNNGLCASGAEGWAGTSYAPVAPLFAAANVPDPVRGVNINRAKFNMASLSANKGTTNQVGIVERFTSFPKYGWSNATLYPMSQSYWGMNPYGSAYGAWGLFPPQTGMGAADAHPYYPNSGHGACQVALMDGAIRSVKASVSASTWRLLCDPEAMEPIPGDWD